MLVWVLGAGWAGAQTLEVTGTCPSITWAAEGLTPGGRAVLMGARQPGQQTLPVGPCAGSLTGLGPLVRSQVLRTDEVGGYLRATALAGGECRAAYQLLDLATCRVSNVVRIDRDFGVLAGSYVVGEGQPWSAGAKPVSCLDACAAQFGGDAEDYWCSTDGDGVDHLAYVDGWGDDRLCTQPQPEDYAVGDSTRCAGDGCYASAWVADHDCAAVNYCWLR
ncbi:MAG: hypothetical protein R3F59_35305 [Myxococcota bacterium]